MSAYDMYMYCCVAGSVWHNGAVMVVAQAVTLVCCACSDDGSGIAAEISASKDSNSQLKHYQSANRGIHFVSRLCLFMHLKKCLQLLYDCVSILSPLHNTTLVQRRVASSYLNVT